MTWIITCTDNHHVNNNVEWLEEKVNVAHPGTRCVRVCVCGDRRACSLQIHACKYRRTCNTNSLLGWSVKEEVAREIFVRQAGGQDTEVI